MPLLLICTVGGAPERVVRSVLEKPRPASVIFVCSRGSEASISHPPSHPCRIEKTCALCGDANHECVNPTGILARVSAAGFDLPDHRTVMVEDPQDVTKCLRDMERQLTPAVARWRRTGPDHSVTADPTGGTKCMSAALGMVARRWNCRLRYIGGSSRSRRGVGVVENSRETLFSCDNPSPGWTRAEMSG
jgi:hypothetical protein